MALSLKNREEVHKIELSFVALQRSLANHWNTTTTIEVAGPNLECRAKRGDFLNRLSIEGGALYVRSQVKV